MLPKEKGLSISEAKARLATYGPNTLPEKPPVSGLTIFFSQLKNPLVYVLLLAGFVTLALRHFSDTLIIFVAVLINTILGYFQERRAGKALSALKKLVTPQAEVIRDARRIKIDAKEIVPGDVVVLAQGDKVPADGNLIYANRLFIEEALLTGESEPVSKKESAEVYMGTLVSSGQGIARIEKTGGETKVGKIALQVQEVPEDTPLKKQLTIFSRQLLILVSILTAFVFVVGVVTREETIEIFKTAVALAVSAIPEGLLVSLTVVLAIGMQRILRRKGLVRNLASAETLGGVTTICVDKTGTLTEGKMRAVDVLGEEEELATQTVLANDLDDPLVISAFEWGSSKVADITDKYPRLDSLPFSSKERFFASLNRWEDDENMLFVNGAPEFLLKWSNLEENEKQEIVKQIEELTTQGKRLIGFARKKVSSDKVKVVAEDVKDGLTWIGILSFSDPVRAGVKEALEKARGAGIKIIAITGDYSKTAEAVLSQIGMPVTPEEIITGEELEKLDVPELAQKVNKIKLFARTTPDQKLKIVEALQRNGEVVGMMGDGVNDAPAITRADIGIAVGEATDVAKESSGLVLLDSNFATIVAAIEEGRGIFENIRKIILYLLSDAFAEIIAVVGAIILGLPLPVTAVQILWINLVSDGFPNLALTVDPKREDIMAEAPRPPQEKVVTPWMRMIIASVSTASGVLTLLYFIYVLNLTKDVSMARSIAFLALGLNSLTYVFSIRNLSKPFWRANLFSNKWLVLAVLAGFGLQALPFISPLTRSFFGTVSLAPIYWMGALAISVGMFIIIEVSKLALRYNHK